MSRYDARILIVDDEINNIKLLTGDLEDDGYSNFLSARDGLEALKILETEKDNIDLVLLDRMMPKMDGMEVMRHLKSNPEISHIPVIMQTAAAAKEQMLEGIAAGVYYYLTKPYDEETMLAIVRAALRDHSAFQSLRNNIQQFKEKAHLLKNGLFIIKTLDDAAYLGTFLSGFFPEPKRAITGLSELMINAVEHGNLNISYEEKGRLLIDGIWREEVERRQLLQENKDKYVEVYYSREPDCIEVKIKDQGEGFEWKEYLDITPDRATHYHGRGIAMARLMSFDTLDYHGKGNEVHCTVRVND